ncbi:MAG: Ku protein [Cytophagaceae bacterium]
MRSIWSGAISFGLVNIPIKLYSAVGDNSLSFSLLSKKDHAPVKYKKVSSLDGEELGTDDIVKGYEFSKGNYVIMDEKDFQKASPEKTKSIEIIHFVYEDEIDPIFFDKPYYLEPDKNATKPYALLREALRKTKKVGIATFVLRNKEYIAVIKPLDDVIVINILRYEADIRDPKQLSLPDSALVNDKELEMAVMLVEQLTEEFNPEKFKDTYTEELKEILEAKARGEVLEIRQKKKAPTQADNLLDTLRASLQAGKSNERPAAQREKKSRQKVKNR